MEVHVSLGRSHHFELREVLLIYKGGRESFITHHDVTSQSQGPPTLRPAQPLTTQFLDSLVDSLGRSVDSEILPEHVLAKGDRSIVWWTPRRYRQMFYRSTQGKCELLNGKVFPQPPLVWRVSRGALSIRALQENKRPCATTKLAFAPFWNLSHNGEVCLGSMPHPGSATVASLEGWEVGFYGSAFTHGNVARITKHPGGFEEMWSDLCGRRKAFPVEHLIGISQTLSQFV